MTILTQLAACGGASAPDSGPLARSLPAIASVAPQALAPAQAVASRTPLPDCQPEQCAGLRIIDGNAEAYRFDAQRARPPG